MVPVNPPSVINPLLESAVQSASHQLLKSIFLSVITESREARDHAARLLTTEEPADHASARSIDPEASQSEEGHQVVESNDDSNGGLMPNLVLGTADVPCFAPPYFALPTPEVLVNEGEGPNEQLQKRPNATMHPAAEATASKKRSREEAEQPRPPPQPRKRVQRYEACKNCKVEYDVGTNWRYACKWHSGKLLRCADLAQTRLILVFRRKAIG